METHDVLGKVRNERGGGFITATVIMCERVTGLWLLVYFLTLEEDTLLLRFYLLCFLWNVLLIFYYFYFPHKREREYTPKTVYLYMCMSVNTNSSISQVSPVSHLYHIYNVGVGLWP